MYQPACSVIACPKETSYLFGSLCLYPFVLTNYRAPNQPRQVIILSAVRSNHGGRVGFLADWRRLNVAITRARRGIIVVGDPDTLKRDRHWRAFLQWCERRGAAMGETSLYLAGGGGEREEVVGSAVSPWIKRAVKGVGEKASAAGVAAPDSPAGGDVP